jgi:hypothetical protein
VLHIDLSFRVFDAYTTVVFTIAFIAELVLASTHHMIATLRFFNPTSTFGAFFHFGSPNTVYKGIEIVIYVFVPAMLLTTQSQM